MRNRKNNENENHCTYTVIQLYDCEARAYRKKKRFKCTVLTPERWRRFAHTSTHAHPRRDRRHGSHSLFSNGAADTSSTVMARTEQVLVAVYRCCYALALLQPGIAGMAVTAAGSGDQQQQLRQPVANGGHEGTAVTADIGGAVADDGLAARAARNKRWSTTFGANTGNKNNNTGERAVPLYTQHSCSTAI